MINENNNVVKKRLKNLLINSSLIIWRFILATMSILIVIFIALKIPETLKDMDFSWTSIDVKMIYGGSILGGAIVLATLKFIGEKAPVLWRYIAHNKPEKMIELYSAVFVAVLGFSIANLSLKEIVQANPQNIPSPPPSPVFLNITTPSASLANASGLPVFFITFPEGNSELKEIDAQRSLLKNIVKTLLECSKIGNIHRQNIKIKTVGYASSSGTDIENMKLANQRAKWVKNYLSNIIIESAINKDHITIVPQLWKSFSEMRIRRIFVDENLSKTLNNRYSEQAGALNRRVEIHLLDVGGCQT